MSLHPHSDTRWVRGGRSNTVWVADIYDALRMAPELLHHHDMVDMPDCPFYPGTTEDADHLRLLPHHNTPDSALRAAETAVGTLQNLPLREAYTVALAVLWTVWKARNTMIFNGFGSQQHQARDRPADGEGEESPGRSDGAGGSRSAEASPDHGGREERRWLSCVYCFFLFDRRGGRQPTQQPLAALRACSRHGARAWAARTDPAGGTRCRRRPTRIHRQHSQPPADRLPRIHSPLSPGHPHGSTRSSSNRHQSPASAPSDGARASLHRRVCLATPLADYVWGRRSLPCRRLAGGRNGQ
ncbi:hypothetical protein HU200_003693 [Digitaria exilis]|uniref:Uncharacterized protein n=1 Tax=Digitaria exilis TaxID=1010633 RepID=A0A835KUG2_9POAL|nr:hypothetical protein HU200_003693 [Digitaria exilis]